MQPEPNIRPALASDEFALFTLVNQLHASISVEKAQFEAVFTTVLREPYHCCLVIETNSEVVGYASGYRHVNLASGGQVAFLDEIVINPALRGRGLGRCLMTAFERWASEHGCKLVALATGGARGFYQQLGYHSRAGYYKKSLK